MPMTRLFLLHGTIELPLWKRASPKQELFAIIYLFRELAIKLSLLWSYMCIEEGGDYYNSHFSLLFLWTQRIYSNKTRGNRQNLKYRKFYTNTRRNFFIVRVMEHWNRIATYLGNLLQGIRFSSGLDSMNSRGSFQTLQFCDSVFTAVNSSVVLLFCVHYMLETESVVLMRNLPLQEPYSWTKNTSISRTSLGCSSSQCICVKYVYYNNVFQLW